MHAAGPVILDVCVQYTLVITITGGGTMIAPYGLNDQSAPTVGINLLSLLRAIRRTDHQI